MRDPATTLATWPRPAWANRTCRSAAGTLEHRRRGGRIAIRQQPRPVEVFLYVQDNVDSSGPRMSVTRRAPRIGIGENISLTLPMSRQLVGMLLELHALVDDAVVPVPSPSKPAAPETIAPAEQPASRRTADPAPVPPVEFRGGES